MEHCFLRGTSTFFGKKQTAIYLHNKEKSNLLVKILDKNESFEISEGNGVQIIDSKSEITCQNSQECFITIWHTSLDEYKSFFVSDGAGCSVSINDKIPSDISLFFDFGDNTRLSSGSFKHKRETGIMLYYIDQDQSNETLSKIVNQNLNFDLSGPAILKISSTAYTKATFDILIGSTVKIPDSFSNNPVNGHFLKYTKSDTINQKSYLMSQSINDTEPTINILMASEKKGWYYLSIVMCGLTALFFVSSIASISYIFISYRRKKAQMTHVM